MALRRFHLNGVWDIRALQTRLLTHSHGMLAKYPRSKPVWETGTTGKAANRAATALSRLGAIAMKVSDTDALKLLDRRRPHINSKGLAIDLLETFIPVLTCSRQGPHRRARRQGEVGF